MSPENLTRCRVFSRVHIPRDTIVMKSQRMLLSSECPVSCCQGLRTSRECFMEASTKKGFKVSPRATGEYRQGVKGEKLVTCRLKTV